MVSASSKEQGLQQLVSIEALNPYSAGVVEIIKDYSGDTFRAVYTVRTAGAGYVLHAFQKESKTGRETARRDLNLIK